MIPVFDGLCVYLEGEGGDRVHVSLSRFIQNVCNRQNKSALRFIFLPSKRLPIKAFQTTYTSYINKGTQLQLPVSMLCWTTKHFLKGHTIIEFACLPKEQSSMLEINFFAGSKYLLPGIKDRSKTNIPSSKYWWLWNS